MTSGPQCIILSIIINGRDLPGVPWLGLYASTAGDTSSTAGQGTKIPHAMDVAPPKKLIVSIINWFIPRPPAPQARVDQCSLLTAAKRQSYTQHTKCFPRQRVMARNAKTGQGLVGRQVSFLGPPGVAGQV